MPRPRSVPLVAVASFVGLLAVACGSGDPGQLSGEAANIYAGECASSTGEQVTIYSGRTENLINPILEAFACETGHDVRVRWGSSTDLAALINEEGNATEADVFLSRSPGPVGFLEANDRLGQVDPDVLALVDDDLRASEGTWVGFSGRERVLVRNIDEVSDDELPASVFDLVDEQYRGRVALPATNGSFEDWFTVFRSEMGDDVATQWLDDMVANDARYYPNNRAIVEAVGRAEIDLGLVNHYYNYQEQAVRGDDHRATNETFDDGDIGSLLIITAAAVTAATDNADVGNELIAYLLGEGAQRYFTDVTFEYPLVRGIAPNEALPPLEAAGTGTVDYDALGGGFEATEAIIQESGILNQ